MMDRCVICGAAMDAAGRCTKCRWKDPKVMRPSTVSRCPVCGAEAANGRCVKCEWKEA